MKEIGRRMIFAALMLLCLSTQVLALPQTLVPVGRTVGIHLCGGLVVVGFDEDVGADARAVGVRVGDRIETVNGVKVETMEELRAAADGTSGVYLTVARDGKQVEFYLTPVQTPEGGRIGLKVRDGITGVGTVTFYDPESGGYGALGHSVNDPETGERISISGGSIRMASVTEVVRGKPGSPGELHGSFGAESPLGDVRSNSPAGIFGLMQAPEGCGAPLPLATAAQARPTQAEILSNVSGSDVRPYRVEILRIEPENESGRNYLLRVRDDTLLAKTGGIVQGMSGSPIVQDGKLIGAVTHVLIDNPSVGYGISIERMLQESDAA